MLPRICLAMKGVRPLERWVARTFSSMDQTPPADQISPEDPSPSEPVQLSAPKFPRPLPQTFPLYTPEQPVNDKPPIIDIPPESDPLLAYITSHLMSDGKRHAAARRTSRILLHLHAITRSPPLPILREAIFLAGPSIRIVSHKQGGKTVQKPIPLGEKQRTWFAIKWISEACKKRNGKKVEERFAREVVEIVKQDPGNEVLEKKRKIHQLGMVNRANAKVKV